MSHYIQNMALGILSRAANTLFESGFKVWQLNTLEQTFESSAQAQILALVQVFTPAQVKALAQAQKKLQAQILTLEQIQAVLKAIDLQGSQVPFTQAPFTQAQAELQAAFTQTQAEAILAIAIVALLEAIIPFSPLSQSAKIEQAQPLVTALVKAYVQAGLTQAQQQAISEAGFTLTQIQTQALTLTQIVAVEQAILQAGLTQTQLQLFQASAEAQQIQAYAEAGLTQEQQQAILEAGFTLTQIQSIYQAIISQTLTPTQIQTLKEVIIGAGITQAQVQANQKLEQALLQVQLASTQLTALIGGVLESPLLTSTTQTQVQTLLQTLLQVGLTPAQIQELSKAGFTQLQLQALIQKFTPAQFQAIQAVLQALQGILQAGFTQVQIQVLLEVVEFNFISTQAGFTETQIEAIFEAKQKLEQAQANQAQAILQAAFPQTQTAFPQFPQTQAEAILALLQAIKKKNLVATIYAQVQIQALLQGILQAGLTQEQIQAQIQAPLQAIIQAGFTQAQIEAIVQGILQAGSPQAKIQLLQGIQGILQTGSSQAQIQKILEGIDPLKTSSKEKINKYEIMLEGAHAYSVDITSDTEVNIYLDTKLIHKSSRGRGLVHVSTIVEPVQQTMMYIDGTNQTNILIQKI